ncbi:MAG: hypothetical protein ACRDSR_26490 [Pseudonocardiaceae bacterium]
MTLPRTVADVLTDHVVFEVECIDRMYCNVYVPQLQHAGGLLSYIQRQLGLPIASTAPLGKITDAFSAAMRRFARDRSGACHYNCVSHGWTKIGRRDRHSVGKGTICEPGQQCR